ncbi:hypothetical protein AK830_g2805 [Neonectria ditissima]|uniref:Zn(2)-C6 fungal-type domain-containing protein n=1 Tax=Neonectria ditissima TaxID=78410 RepID=A0A0P7B1M8_9HYPO|nr:hypothetical protein AK830_g2805 [Neonectria ditissima]
MAYTVGIAGITGKFARNVAANLLKRPEVSIRGFCRDPTKLPASILSSPRVHIIKGESTDTAALKSFAKTSDVVVCCYLGDNSLMTQGQKLLIDACEAEGVRRYLASDYSLDFTKLEYGQLPAKDPMKHVKAYLDTKTIKGVHVLIGIFMETFWSRFVGIWNSDATTLSYWGTGDEVWESTTYANASEFVAAVALDECARGTKVIRQIAETFKAVHGVEPELKNLGSLDGLRKTMLQIQEKDPRNFFSYIPLFYQYYCTNGQTYLDGAIDRPRYPELKRVTFEDFLKSHSIEELSDASQAVASDQDSPPFMRTNGKRGPIYAPYPLSRACRQAASPNSTFPPLSDHLTPWNPTVASKIRLPSEQSDIPLALVFLIKHNPVLNMPRKKTKTKQPSQRSHHGCQRCRLHKIRCDEAKPSCGACTSRGYLDCTFLLVLKWEADYRHVGRAFGRAGVWSKAGRIPTQQPAVVCRPDLGRVPYVHQSGFLNLSMLDFEDSREETDEDQLLPLLTSSNQTSPRSGNAHPQAIQSLIPRPINDPILDNLQLVDPHLISYYVHQVCPLTVPSATYAAGSPFSALLFPFALSSSSTALMHAVLGLAASHRARFDKSFNPIALNYSRTALRSLRISLASKTSTEIAVDPETLVLMMVLCQTELIKDGDSNWVVHLRGARNLLSFRRRQQQLASTGTEVSTRQQENPWEQVVVFAERFFAFCDVMGRTACGEEPIFGNDFWSIQEGQVDLWMGCSPHLVSIISTIAELSWKYHRRSPSYDEQQELGRQRSQLHDLLQQPDLGWISTDTEDDGVLRRCVELKRLTVDLYLHAALANTTPLTPTIRQRVQKILRLVHVLLNMGVKSGLAWPLFMAACQLDPEEELEWSTPEDERKDEIPSYARPFILYALGELSESLFNVDRTRTVIEKVWKKRESARLSTVARQGVLATGAFNDWARFVAPLCHNISLA